MKRRTFIELTGILGLGFSLQSKVQASVINSVNEPLVGLGTTNKVIKVLGVGISNKSFLTSAFGVDQVNVAGIDIDKEIVGMGVGDCSDDIQKIQRLFKSNPWYISKHLEGVQVLFLVAGIGGLVGSVVTPMIAKAAKELGINTVAIVSSVFEMQAFERRAIARVGLMELNHNVDALILLDNDKLMDFLGIDSTFDRLFSETRSMTAGMVRHIVTNVKNQELASSHNDRKKILDLAVDKAMAMGSESRRLVMSIYQPELIRPILS